jgi:hypothetical protein
MTTVPELLRNADPLAREPRRSDRDRHRSRQVVIETASVAGDVPRRAVVKTVFAAAALVAIVAGGLYWSRASVDVVAAVRFDVRLAEESFAPGLREATVGGGRKIYLHPETVVTNSDIAEATLVQNESAFGVSVVFKADGAEKMRRATQSHVGKPLAILIDGKVVMAPVVRSATGREAFINGDYTKAEAERIAAGMIGR